MVNVGHTKNKPIYRFIPNPMGLLELSILYLACLAVAIICCISPIKENILFCLIPIGVSVAGGIVILLNILLYNFPVCVDKYGIKRLVKFHLIEIKWEDLQSITEKVDWFRSPRGAACEVMILTSTNGDVLKFETSPFRRRIIVGKCSNYVAKREYFDKYPNARL